MKIMFENSKYSESHDMKLRYNDKGEPVYKDGTIIKRLKKTPINTQSYHNINMINAPLPINTATPIMYNPNYNDIKPRGDSTP